MPNSVPATLRIAVVAALTVAALTACGDPSPNPAHRAESRPLSVHAVPVVSGDYSGELPIAAYSLTSAQSETIRSAESVLAEACLKRYGISYSFLSQPESRIADRRYGLSSPVEAAKFGYHLPPNPTQESSAPTPPGLLLVLRGQTGKNGSTTPATYDGKPVPDGGCQTEALERIEGRHAQAAASAEAGSIASSSYAKSLTDPRVTAAFRSWSGCMSARGGYTYATPMKAMDDPAFAKPEPAPNEIPTAVADVACKQKTGLLRTWFATESAIQTAMINKDAKTLAELKRSHHAELVDAEAVLHG